MGSPKALLRAPDGQPFVVRIARAFADAGVTDIVVVTGADHDAIAEAVRLVVAAAAVRPAGSAPPPATAQIAGAVRISCARNPDPARGQLSSLWVGLDAVIRPEVEACLVTLVDVPMLRAETVSRVVAAWRRTGAPIVRPALGDRHGHPVLFARSLFDELRNAPLDIGAKAVVRAHAAEIWNEPVADEGCLSDVDTPDDYRRLSAE
jgi:molybdenum cofactor cytidylyltransferase